MTNKSDQANAVQENQGVDTSLQIRCPFCNSPIDERFGFCTLCYRPKEKTITDQEKLESGVRQIGAKSTPASTVRPTTDDKEGQIVATDHNGVVHDPLDTRFGFCTLYYRQKEKMITSQEKMETEVTQIEIESTAASLAKPAIDNEEKQIVAIDPALEENYPPDTFKFRAADCIEYTLDKMGDGIIYAIGKIYEFIAWILRLIHIR